MAAPRVPLTRILQPNNLDIATQTEVLRSYFGTKYQRPSRYFSSFIAYYAEEPRKLQTGLTRSDWPIPNLDETTHGDILGITTTLRENRDQKRQVVRQILKLDQTYHNERSIDHLCDLSIRMWLMINVLDADIDLVDDEAPRKPWLEYQSLDDLIKSLFPQSRIDLNLKESRLDPYFTATNLEKICGLRLEWTQCLANHLRLDRRKKVLWVFPHKEFLQGHLDYESDEVSNPGTTDAQRRIFPEGLLRETILTLNLLFPPWDPSTNNLLKRHGQRFHEQEPLDEPGRLSLQEFSYWRDRLLDLYEIVFLAPPDGWRQLWADRRNRVQWYTFWIALVVLILSVVSCVASILQTWATLKSLFSGA